MCFNGIDNEINALADFHFEQKTQMLQEIQDTVILDSKSSGLVKYKAVVTSSLVVEQHCVV